LLGVLLFVLAGSTRARGQIAVVGDGGPGPVKAQHLTVELASLGPAIAPGGTQVVGLVFSIEEPWHIYWVNAGDSGEPPHIAWTLPAGISAGPMQFPIPERLPLGPLMDFGYEDEVAFPVTISAAATAKPGPVHLDAQVDWLVCAQVCLPGKAHLGIDLNVQPGAPQPAQEPLVGALGEALTLLPKPLPAGASFSVRADSAQFELTLIDGTSLTTAEFYPYDKDPTDIIQNAADQDTEPLRDGIRLYVPRSPDLAALPHTLHGVLKLSDTLGYDVTAPVVASDTPIVEAPPPTTFAGSADAIGLAFLGGILLNLMPCVFPVLFLKGLALVQTASAGDTVQRGEMRRHSLVYALGILASFWAIVAVLLLLRATGSRAGWGFQLQSPVFLAVLASFLFLFALSLAGQFDIGLSLTSVGGELAQKQGYAGSFFTGVLATVVATPCTAPFMGAAVGFALAQSGAVTFAVFTALALGLAAPYVLLSWQPAWARLLPRPGAWMEVLKHITAAVFFATVIWLAWVYGQVRGAGGDADAGVNQIALLLVCFLLMAVAGWVLGRWPAKWGSSIAAVLLIALGLAIPLSQARDAKPAGAEPASAAGALAPNGGAGNEAEVVWQPYSQQAQDAAHAAGHPVFIDFTAAWCLSCQYNERAVLKSADVESALLKGGVVTMKADWTNADPAITQKLASVGRAGVPTYVIYPAGATAVADVLPELLTKDLVLKAIERDTK
jgi:thiol:disulfide interchange protein DsbD